MRHVTPLTAAFCCGQARQGRQAGQAMVEFMIAAITLLVPLFFMISYIAKYHDLQAATIQAARYAAWERTVYFGGSGWAGDKSDAVISEEIKSRFFSGPGSALQSSAGAQNPLWVDHAGASMLGTWGQTSSSGQTPGTGDFVVDKVVKVLSVVSKVTGAPEFKLDMKSLYTATVTATPSQSSPMARMFTGSDNPYKATSDTTPQLFSLPAVTQQVFLVANGWSANGPDFVTKQTQALTPLTSIFSRTPFSDVLNVVQTTLGTFHEELKSSNLNFGGKIQVDTVPGDRISGGSAPPVKKTNISASDRADAQQKSQTDTANQQKDALEKTKAAFENELKAIDDKIKSCDASKKAEMSSNYYGSRTVTRSVVNGCSRRYCKDEWAGTCWGGSGTESYTCDKQVTEEYVKTKPGSSWTPTSDADTSCTTGLDSRITQNRTNLQNDPLIQQALEGCKKASTPDCAELNKELAKADTDTAKRRTDKANIAPALNSCGCAAGVGTQCIAQNGSSCKR
jgi:hypothetical protein